MASIVSAGTTSATALNMSADTSGVLQLASNNGTVALTITTGQAVGIGTTSPTSFGANVKLVLSAAGNDTNLFVVSGLSKAIRVGTSTTESTIQGVDQTGVASYQPVGIEGGGYIRFSTGSAGGGSTTERMKIDGSGYVTTPYQPSFTAWLTSGVFSTTPNTIPFNSVQFNTSSSYSTSTYRFTAPVTGTYMFFVIGITNTGTILELGMYLNNSSQIANCRTAGSSSGTNQGCSSTVIWPLTAGDFVDARLLAGNVYGSGLYTAFGGYLLG